MTTVKNITADDQPTDFSDFLLANPLLQALEKEKYTTPTPIQAQAIPLVLHGDDLLGIAQTGTGKTAAFALPSLNHICRNPIQRTPTSVRTLILAPTRELVGQIAKSYETYGQFFKPSVCQVVGGVNINRQIRELSRGVDVLVATPGRLIDLMNQKAVTLKEVEILVLDEADQMLDMGFIHALRKIIPYLPKKRQTLFFSATMPKAIADLAKQFLTDPAKVSVAPASTTAERVSQSMSFISKGDKPALLVATIESNPIERALIFVRTKHGADKVVRQLGAANIEAVAIHGNKSQPQRERALQAFREGKILFLIATDIAARGIDIPGVSHVINYDVPNIPEQYVHRIGRTARAGASGEAISFVDSEEKSFIKQIEKVTRQKIPVLDLPEDFDDILARVKSLKLPPKKSGATGGRNAKGGGRNGQGRRGSGGKPPSQRNGPPTRGRRGNGATQRPDQIEAREAAKSGKPAKKRAPIAEGASATPAGKKPHRGKRPFDAKPGGQSRKRPTGKTGGKPGVKLGAKSGGRPGNSTRGQMSPKPRKTQKGG